MSRDQFVQAPQPAIPDMPMFILSTSHMRKSGAPATMQHERRQSGVSLGQPPTSHRRPSYTISQNLKTPTIMEEGREEGEDLVCEVSVHDDAPMVRVVHHTSRPSGQGHQGSTRRASAGGASADSGSRQALCSPKLLQSTSPMSRPGTAPARPMSPLIRTLSPKQAGRLSSVVPPPSDGRPLPMPQTTELDSRRAAYSRSRSASWPNSQWPSPTLLHRPGSTLISIYEEVDDVEEDEEGGHAPHDHSSSGQQMELRVRAKENSDVADSSSRTMYKKTTPAAALTAAAVSTAALEGGIESIIRDPCLDCLEEFVRRKRAANGNSAVEKNSNGFEKADKKPRSQHPAVAVTLLQSKKASKTSNEHSVRLATSERGHASSSPATKAGVVRASSLAASKSKPAENSASKAPEIRCPMCKACRSCGNIWPLPTNQ